MKTKMEQAFECMVKVYHQFCILDPIDDFLHPKEFKKLMKEQAQPYLKACTPHDQDQDRYIQDLFQKADKDKNGYLTFTEFLCVSMAMLNEAHERSHDLDGGHKTSGHGHGHSH